MPYDTYAICERGKKSRLLGEILINSTLITKRLIPIELASTNTLILTAKESAIRTCFRSLFRCLVCSKEELFDIAIDFNDTPEDIADLIIMVSQLLDDSI